MQLLVNCPFKNSFYLRALWPPTSFSPHFSLHKSCLSQTCCPQEIFLMKTNFTAPPYSVPSHRHWVLRPYPSRHTLCPGTFPTCLLCYCCILSLSFQSPSTARPRTMLTWNWSAAHSSQARRILENLNKHIVATPSTVLEVLKVTVMMTGWRRRNDQFSIFRIFRE